MVSLQASRRLFSSSDTPIRDDRENFLVLTLPAEFSERLPARELAPVAVGILVVMVVAMAFELVPTSAAALFAALAMIASGCVGLESIYRVVSWKTVVLIAGMFPLATALTKTGEWTGFGFGIARTACNAGGIVFPHRTRGAISFELSDRGVGRAYCYRCGRESSRFAARICDDCSDRLLRRIRYTRIIASEYVGYGTRRLCLWRLC